MEEIKKNKNKKLRLSIFDDHSLEEVKSIRLSKGIIFSIIGGSVLIIILLVFLLLVFTPLNMLIPSKGSLGVKNKVIEHSLMIDSLERNILSEENYLTQLKNIIEGNIPTDTFKIENLYNDTSLSVSKSDFESSDLDSIISTGINLKIKEKDNLILKAYYLLKKEYNLPELNIHLHKIIPTGAGLGGGSSDASFMLKSLNNYFNLKITKDNLENYAQQLGSDCPFFIKNKVVFAEGTGDIFKTIKLELSKYFILIVKPDIHISTKVAFSGIHPKKPHQSLNELIKLPLNEWKNYIKNDFENTVFLNFPEIKNIKKTLYNSGAAYAQMSGSGAAVFGIFEKEPIIPDEFHSYFYYIQKPLIY